MLYQGVFKLKINGYEISKKEMQKKKNSKLFKYKSIIQNCLETTS